MRTDDDGVGRVARSRLDDDVGGGPGRSRPWELDLEALEDYVVACRLQSWLAT